MSADALERVDEEPGRAQGLAARPSIAAGRDQARRDWIDQAVDLIECDFNRSAETHLIFLDAPGFPGVRIYLKDESSHPTGSLKHRLARSLFLYALCDGRIGPGTPIVEASSGSTAVSEAYFARMLGLPFYAVLPRSTAVEKLAAIEFYGGKPHFVDDPCEVYRAAEDLARKYGGVYLDQFTFAERATDWRGNNNIAESIFQQMSREKYPVPAWIVCGAGTGGTSATIGRYLRYKRTSTRLCVADPQASVFHRHWRDRAIARSPARPSVIEGIGRGRVEPSFRPDVVDEMIAVGDASSIAAARLLSERLGRRCGGSSGTNLVAVAALAKEMCEAGVAGSIVTLLCDHGERYASTYYNDDWLAERNFDLSVEDGKLRKAFGWD